MLLVQYWEVQIRGIDWWCAGLLEKIHDKTMEKYENQQELFVELYPEPILIHREGSILHANQACVNILGASSLMELLGKSILDFSSPEYKDIVEKRIRQLNQPGVVVTPTEEKVIRLDGKVIDVEVRGISLNIDGKPSYFMIFHDLTSKKQAEKTLRQSEERYRLIAENMTDLVCLIDRNGLFKYASPSHVTVLGFPSETYEGKCGKDFLHKDDFKHVRKHLVDIAATKKSGVFNFRFNNIKGNWIWLEAKATPIYDEKGIFEHFLVVSRDITERKMYEERLTYLAFHDTLTGLPNRRLFKQRLEQALKEAERYERKMAVMYLDIDNFKHVNDTLGHDMGDELLKQLAQRVKECLRESDTISRQGGDEITILLPEISNERDAIQIANRIINSLREPWYIGELAFRVTSSIGIAFYPNGGKTRRELMKSADIALYEAKENGRNNCKIYSLENDIEIKGFKDDEIYNCFLTTSRKENQDQPE